MFAFLKKDPAAVNQRLVHKYVRLRAKVRKLMDSGMVSKGQQLREELELIRARANEATNKAIDLTYC